MYQVSLTESYFPAHGGPEPAPRTIGDMLRASTARKPDQPALRALDYDGTVLRTWSYKELLFDAERLARALASRHEEGARIAVYANNVPEWVLLELACGLAGITLVTGEPGLPEARTEITCSNSPGPKAIYYVADFRGNPMQEIADEVCNEIPAIRHRILLTDHAALFDGRSAGRVAHARPERPDTDPVHVRHDRLSEGRPAPS